ncbi:MAG: hypothetical protein JWM16_4415 [Verrucomicrobiales bacterium]|nr:hypothetical protein [Verrucomicrobiales bacterium]
MTKQTTKWLLIASLALVGSFQARANLVSNGDFEVPSLANPAYDYLNGTQLTDWTIFSPHNGIVHFGSAYRPVGGGLYSVQIEYPGDSISQSLATLVGATYRFSIDLSTYDTSAGKLGVSLTGAAFQSFDGTPSYVNHSFDFVATSTTTVLTLSSLNFYPHIDNVSVEALSSVPDMGSTMLLLTSSCMGLAFIRRRMR